MNWLSNCNMLKLHLFNAILKASESSTSAAVDEEGDEYLAPDSDDDGDDEVITAKTNGITFAAKRNNQYLCVATHS